MNILIDAHSGVTGYTQLNVAILRESFNQLKPPLECVCVGGGHIGTLASF